MRVTFTLSLSLPLLLEAVSLQCSLDATRAIRKVTAKLMTRTTTIIDIQLVTTHDDGRGKTRRMTRNEVMPALKAYGARG